MRLHPWSRRLLILSLLLVLFARLALESRHLSFTLHDALLSRAGLWRQRVGLKAIVPEDDFLVWMTEPLQTAYRQWDYRQIPAFVTYAAAGDQAMLPALVRRVYLAPVESAPLTLTVSRDGPLAFRWRM